MAVYANEDGTIKKLTADIDLDTTSNDAKNSCMNPITIFRYKAGATANQYGYVSYWSTSVERFVVFKYTFSSNTATSLSSPTAIYYFDDGRNGFSTSILIDPYLNLSDSGAYIRKVDETSDVLNTVFLIFAFNPPIR